MISVTDAVLGNRDHGTLSGWVIQSESRSGTQSGTATKLRGKGLPAVSGYGSGTGDLYVKILVWIPKRLSSDERNALENMRTSRSFTPDPSRDDKALFDKMKNIF